MEKGHRQRNVNRPMQDGERGLKLEIIFKQMVTVKVKLQLLAPSTGLKEVAKR